MRAYVVAGLMDPSRWMRWRFANDPNGSNAPATSAAIFFQRHVDRPYYQQCSRYTAWYGDRHDHAHWFVAVWYVGYGLP